MPEPPVYAVSPEPGRSTPARTGPRHDQGGGPDALFDSRTRARSVRLVVVPGALVGAIAAAASWFALAAQPGGLDGASWGVLAGAVVLGVGVLIAAASVASGEARSLQRRYAALRRSSIRSQSDLHGLLRRLEKGERIDPRPVPDLPRPSGDALDQLAYELTTAQRGAEAAVAEAARLVQRSDGSREKVEVFVNLARRLQSLVHREIELLDELENQVEDPDLLKGLFHVDHLATRIRRHAENLAVLGGAISRRQWSRPVTLTEVLRSSIAEVEQYSRVKLVPPIEGTLRGHAVADVIHLLSELVENATVFSSPQTNVLLRTQRVRAGLAVEVEDRGLGMPREEQERMNSLLSDPDHIDVGELLRDGRIGLFVVSALARRHGIVVQLQSNIYGGTQAVLVLPQELLGAENAPNNRPVQAEATAPQPVAAARQPMVPAPPRRGPAPEPLTAPHPQHARAVEPDHSVVRAPTPLPQAAATPPRAEDPPQNAPHTVPSHHADPLPPRPVAEHPAESTGERPQLPRRRRQEHLVPELRDAPSDRPTAGEQEPEHNPELMASFRRGFSLGDASDASTEGPAGNAR